MTYPVCAKCEREVIPDDGELCGACAKSELAAAEERGRDKVLRAHDGWWSDERVRVEIAEAEERGRRRGDAERDELRALIYDMAMFPFDFPQRINDRIRAVVAPRVQASDGPPCVTCNHEKFWHQWSSKEHAFCCSPVGGDYCGCKNYLAPRDSGKDP